VVAGTSAPPAGASRSCPGPPRQPVRPSFPHVGSFQASTDNHNNNNTRKAPPPPTHDTAQHARDWDGGITATPMPACPYHAHDRDASPTGWTGCGPCPAPSQRDGASAGQRCATCDPGAPGCPRTPASTLARHTGTTCTTRPAGTTAARARHLMQALQAREGARCHGCHRHSPCHRYHAEHGPARSDPRCRASPSRAGATLRSRTRAAPPPVPRPSAGARSPAGQPMWRAARRWR
jgi:hypothetical protein